MGADTAAKGPYKLRTIARSIWGREWPASWTDLFVLCGTLLVIAVPAAVVGLYAPVFLALGATLALLAFRSTATACVLVALLSPVMAVGSVDLGFNITPSYPIALAGFAGMLSRQEFRQLRPGVPDLFLAVFVVVAAVVSVGTFGTAPDTTVVDATGVNGRLLRSPAQLAALLLMAGVYALFRVGATQPRVRAAVVRALVVSFALVAAYGAYQIVARWQGLPFAYLNDRRSIDVLPIGTGYVRINSTLTEASPLAQFSILALLIGMAVLLTGPGPRALMSRRAAQGLVVAAVLMVFASLSKAAFVALIVSSVVALGLYRGSLRRRALYVVATLVVLGAAAVFVRMPVVLKDPNVVFATERYLRVGYWQSAVDIVAAHPLGVGVGNFPFYYPRYAPVSYSYEYFQTVTDAHNWFLEAFAETGVLGGSAFACFVVSLIGSSLVAGRRAARDGPMLLCLGSAFLAGALMHLTYSFFYYPFEWVLAGLVAAWAASAAPARSVAPESTATSSRWRLPRTATSASRGG